MNSDKYTGIRGQHPHLETDEVLRETMGMTPQEIEDDLKSMGITPCTGSADELRKFGIPHSKATVVTPRSASNALARLLQSFKHKLHRTIKVPMAGIAIGALVGVLVAAPTALYLSSNGTSGSDQPSVASNKDMMNNTEIVTIPVNAELQETWFLVIGNFDNLDDANDIFLTLESSGYAVAMETNLIEDQTVYSVRIGPYKDKKSRDEAKVKFPDAEVISVYSSN